MLVTMHAPGSVQFILPKGGCPWKPFHCHSCRVAVVPRGAGILGAPALAGGGPRPVGLWFKARSSRVSLHSITAAHSRRVGQLTKIRDAAFGICDTHFGIL